MTTSHQRDAAFAVWLTGLPASGKSTIARALRDRLQRTGVEVELLDSDELRLKLTPEPVYDARERELFYRAIACIAQRLTAHGVVVLIAATANRRAYRDDARAMIDRYMEVFVDCPVQTCESRDPKGLYRRAHAGDLTTLPGVQSAYEPPVEPDVVVHSDRVSADDAAELILRELRRRRWLGDESAA